MPATRYPMDTDTSWSFGRPWTPGVRGLIISLCAIFLAQLAVAQASWLPLLGLQAPECYRDHRWWQPVTYLFLHAGFWHLAFNAFTLWMFGTEVELRIGTRRFLLYYLITGVGAGLCVLAVAAVAGEHSLTIGASGAVFGVLLAYGWLFADRVVTLLVFFVLPVQMKARTMVLIFAALEFFAGVGQSVGRVSHVAHLGGLGIGWLLFTLGWPSRRHEWSGGWPEHRPQRPARIIPAPQDPEAEVDALLDKISQHGLGSLSARERALLAEASRRKRDHSPENN